MIKKVYVNEANKDGVQYVDKNGKIYSRVVLQLEDGRKPAKNIYNSGDMERVKSLEGKDESMIEITRNGEYLNWDFVDMNGLILKRIEKLEAQVSSLMGGNPTLASVGKEFLESKKEDIDVESLPF